MNIQNNLFLERLLSLSSSRFISIAINFGAIPILAAIYGPEQLGNFAYYLSLVIIASSISLLRLEVAIPRQSSIKGANKLLLQCVTIAPILVAVMTVGVLFLASLVNNSLYLSKIFIGFSIFAATLNSLFQNYYLAIEKYHAISIFDSFKSILIVVGQLVANFFFEKNGLEIGFLIGLSLICIIQILYCVPYIDKFENKKLLSLEEIKVLLKENESLLKFSSLSTLANSIINNIPIIFINSCYGALVSGYFYLAYKLLNAPIQVVGN